MAGGCQLTTHMSCPGRFQSRCTLEPADYLTARLLREVHAAQQSLKTWLRTQRIQARIRSNVDHALVVIFVSLLQPGDRLVFWPRPT